MGWNTTDDGVTLLATLTGRTVDLLKSIEKLKKPVQARITQLEAELEKLRGWMASFGGGIVGNGRAATAPAKTGKRRGRRVRRTPEQLTKEGNAVFEMIRKAGKDGIGGGDIRKAHPGVGQDIKQFVEQYTDHKVRTTGKKRLMKYHAAD